MRDFFKRIAAFLRSQWSKWSFAQRIIAVGVVVLLLAGLFLFFNISSTPQKVPLLSRAISDTEALDAIAARLDEEQVEYEITADQRILVNDLQTARMLRSILAREDLIPGGTDPWELFDMERWTQTDFERNINLRRSLTRQLEQHIEALDDVDDASVTLVLPDTELFVEDQNPVTASIIIIPKPGSDIAENRAKISGIQKLVQFAVEGLTPENITITDRSGVVLNELDELGPFDRIELTRRELRLKRELEQRYIQSIHNALAQIYGKDRVEIINVDVVIDMGLKKEETSEFYPIETVIDNPDTPFNEREFVLAIPRSTETINESYEGTGFNPEGPPGQEGQTPPAYQDLEGLVGRYSNDEERINNEINSRTTVSEKSPEISRITAAVALDGEWSWRYDENGNISQNPDGSIIRDYRALTPEELDNAETLVQDAIGFSLARGDSVSVRHIQFDRSEEQEREDAQLQRQQLIYNIIVIAILSVVALALLMLTWRLIVRYRKKRKKAREEELQRQRQVLEQTMQQEGDILSGMKPSELENQVVRAAQERPEDVAQLVRAWIVEK